MQLMEGQLRKSPGRLEMNITLIANWWSLVIRGLLGIAIGVFAFFWPAATLGALVLLFGFYASVDGVLSLVGAVRAVKAHERWTVLLLEGLAGILIGAVTLA